MKNFTKLLLGILFIPLGLSAQFKAIHADKTVFFYSKVNTISAFVPVKIENQKVVNGDTILSNYRKLSFSNSDNFACSVTNKGWAWTGKDIIQTKDHREIFTNSEGELIIFHTNATINDSWVFWSSNDRFFEATVTKKELETFKIHKDQVTDSVLTISISLKKKDDNSPLSHSFNEKEWKISKRYGFIKAYNLYNFPEDVKEMLLAGVEELNLGVKNLTEKDFFSFEIGDELHIKEASLSGDFSESKIIQKVLDKKINSENDSIVYSILVYRNSKLRNPPSTIASIDTISLPVAINPGFNRLNSLPLKSITTDGQIAYTTQFIDSKTSHVAKTIANEGITYPADDLDSCFALILTSEDYDFYLEGLGGPYYDYFINWYSSRDLVYYKKGSEEWGIPLYLVTNLSTNKLTSTIDIFPNPATDKLNISYEDLQNCLYKVYNIEGREILNGVSSGKEEVLDLSNFKAGIYSIMIMKEGNVIFTSRFVKN
jgi:hypothetical protein